jgi:hypothetical protein
VKEGLRPFVSSQESKEKDSQKRKKPSKGQKGKKIPKHSKMDEKYSKRNIPKPLKKLFKKQWKSENSLHKQKGLQKTYLSLLANSLAKQTWKRYLCAHKIWIEFKKFAKKSEHFLIERDKTAFICWCKNYRNLKSQTINMYISALDKIKNLAVGKETKSSLLKGLKNQENKNIDKKTKKKIVDFPTLKKLKENLHDKKSPSFDEILIWTVCLIAFWGCFRLAEILTKKTIAFDKHSDILWRDITFNDKVLFLNLKSTKTSNNKSVQVVLCKTNKKEFCPVHAMKKLKKKQKTLGIFNKKLPVFRKENGENLTKNFFLQQVNKTLEEQTGKFSGKSFRSGIPTLLSKMEKNPDINLIKFAGRWKSSAYRTYIADEDNKVGNFLKISDLLTKSFLT